MICWDSEQHNIHVSVVGVEGGIENTVYHVSEDEGVVEVCAVVSSPDIECPIEFQITARVITRDESAGM